MRSGVRWIICGGFGLAGALTYGLITLDGKPLVDWQSVRAADKSMPGSAMVAMAGNAPSSNSPSSTDGVRVVGYGLIDVEGGTSPLTVPTIGQVKSILVRENDMVKAGQPLIRLTDDLAAAQVQRAESAVAEARVRLDQAKKGPANHQFKKEMQQQAIAAAQAQRDGQKRQVEKLEPLVKNQAITSEDYDAATDMLKRLDAALTAEKLKLDQLALENPQDNIDLAKAAVSAAEAQLEMAKSNLDNHTLKAPSDGLVLRILVNPGQMLGQNQTLPNVWFCPDLPRQVRCEIDQEFASRVAPGMRAIVYDGSSDNQGYPGTVKRTADWIAPKRSMLDEPFMRNDVRTLECSIALDSGHPPYRIGQRVRVVITPDRMASSELTAEKPGNGAPARK